MISTTMSIPTHKRHFHSDSSISIDDMIVWSDEEPMEEETAVPHLLGSLSAMDSFGLDDANPSPTERSMDEGDDPLSRRDSVLNPSPLVLSVRKIYPDEEASMDSTFPANNARKITPQSAPRARVFTMPSPRRVSDSDMVVDESATHQTRPRGGSYHRRASAKDLPAATDLEDVIRGFQVMT